MTEITPTQTPIQRAAELVGGQSELARRLSERGKSITPQGVGVWCRSTEARVPAERVLDIEAITDGQVSRHALRPDLYPDAAAA